VQFFSEKSAVFLKKVQFFFLKSALKMHVFCLSCRQGLIVEFILVVIEFILVVVEFILVVVEFILVVVEFAAEFISVFEAVVGLLLVPYVDNKFAI